MALFRRSLVCIAVTLLASGGAWLAPIPEAVAAPTSAPSAAAAPAYAVDINSADAAALMGVPGIGKSLAQRIIDFRQKNGAFAKVDDLLKVQWIGEKSLERLRPYLTAGKTK